MNYLLAGVALAAVALSAWLWRQERRERATPIWAVLAVSAGLAVAADLAHELTAEPLSTLFHVLNVGALCGLAVSAGLLYTTERRRMQQRLAERDQHARALERLAALGAAALEDTPLHQLLPALAEDLRQLLEAEAVLLQLAGTGAPGVLAGAWPNAEAAVRAAFGADGGETAQVIEAGADQAATRHLLRLPLRVSGQTLGAAYAACTGLAGFTPAARQLAEQGATQMALAVARARLLEAERKQRSLAEALQTTANALSESLDLGEVIDRLLERIEQVVAYSSASVMLVEPNPERPGQRLARVVRSRGVEQYGQRVADNVRGLSFDIETTNNLRTMAASGAPLIIADTRTYPGWLAVGANEHIRSWAGAPIMARGQLIAFFSIDHPAPNFYGAEDVDRLAAFAGQASIAIQNAKLYESTRKRAEDQRQLFLAAHDLAAGLDETAVVTALASHLTTALRLIACRVLSWDPSNDSLRPLPANHPADQPGLRPVYFLDDYPSRRKVLESAAPVAVSLSELNADAAERAVLAKAGGQHLLLAPLASPTQIFGLVELVRGAAVGPFNESERQLALSLTTYAMTALVNAQLHADVKAHAREVDALLGAHTTLLSSLDLDPLLHNLLAGACAAIPAAEKGTILLSDPHSGQLQIRAVFGYADPRVSTFFFASSQGYSAQAMREQRPLLISDAWADPRTRYEGDIQEVRAIRAGIVAPLMLPGKAIGVIALDATHTAAFGVADLRLLVAFAEMAAVAINNAHLHAETRTLATTDPLTGLANRRTFDVKLEQEVTRAGQYGQPLTLVILDIDSFKAYNDTYGHPAGDGRLRALADLLRETLREPDFAARYGGEEFALVLPSTDLTGGRALAERLLARAAAQAPANHTTIAAPVGTPVPGYTFSLGLAVYPHDATTAADLLTAADNAELAAKRAGKNRVVAASDQPAVQQSHEAGNGKN